MQRLLPGSVNSAASDLLRPQAVSHRIAQFLELALYLWERVHPRRAAKQPQGGEVQHLKA